MTGELAMIEAMKAKKIAKDNASKLYSYVWNTDKGLRNWIAAKAKAPFATTPPSIVFFGDSITDSAGATSREYGYVRQYMNSIQLATGLAGRGFISNGVFTPDSTWTTLNEGTNLTLRKATPSSTTFTYKEFAKSIDVIYTKKPDGGQATVRLGGISFTIDCYGATTSYHNIQTCNVGSAMINPIDIVPAANGNTYIEGIIAKSGDAGMLVHQVGHPGICASDYYGNQAAITASTSAFNPDLTVIALGTNDAGQQKPLATYKNALDAIVKEALKTGDVLILSMPDRQDGSTLAIPYSAYVDTAKQVAIANNCAYMSMYDRWQKNYNWANAKGFYVDLVHPSNIGHTDIAELLREVLGGMPVMGVLRQHFDAQYVYGDIRMNTMANSSFRLNGILDVGTGAGKDVSVTQGATTATVTFSQQDGAFSVAVSPNWNTTYWITNKAWNGFTVNFGTAAPSNAKFDWTATR